MGFGRFDGEKYAGDARIGSDNPTQTDRRQYLAEFATIPARSWQSALRQLADTLAPDANVEIDPMDPEVSCARIAEAVERQIAELELERDAKEATIAMAVARLGGTVEGHPTGRHNFLQRIDELREIKDC